MPRVFINFRGQDQAGYAALLDRELTERLGTGTVFLSSRSIPPGEDFVTEILDSLRACTVLLAVIGQQWRTNPTTSNWDRTDGPIDWVHREIAEALATGIRVIPILVEGVRMPAAEALPKDIAALSRCQYLRLHHRNIPHDLARIVAEVRRLLPATPRDVAGQRRAAPGATALFELAHPNASRCRIGVITGDIRGVRTVDVWVNSENTDMEMSRVTEFSTSAIIRYWGARRDRAGRVLRDVISAELAERVGGRRPVAPCTAFVTGPGALAETNNVRHVVHVAAVHGEPGAGFRQVRDIGACVISALTEAERLAASDSVRSILFPILGTGVASASVEPTVTALVAAATDYLVGAPRTRLRAIYLLAYTEAEQTALAHVLARSPRLRPVRCTATPSA